MDSYFQATRARMAQSKRQITRPTQGARKSRSGESAAWAKDRVARQEAVHPREEEALRARHGRPSHQPNVPKAHRQLCQKTD